MFLLVTFSLVIFLDHAVEAESNGAFRAVDQSRFLNQAIPYSLPSKLESMRYGDRTGLLVFLAPMGLLQRASEVMGIGLLLLMGLLLVSLF